RPLHYNNAHSSSVCSPKRSRGLWLGAQQPDMCSAKDRARVLQHKKEQEAMENIDRRTVFASGLAAASLISNTSAFAQQATGGSAETRLRELGIELPKTTAPVANYVPAARLGNVVYLAGTGPIKPDGTLATGKV